MRYAIFLLMLLTAAPVLPSGGFSLMCVSGGSVAECSQPCYRALDVSDPVVFLGDRVVYGGDTIVLGPKAIFIDGNITDEMAENHPFVFNSFRKAAGCFVDGTSDEPMRVYLAPYVYWADSPDTPAVAVGRDGREPFGMVIRCANLHLTGLTRDARNVVLASQRGQTQGAVGNFTMFDFYGDGLQVSNLTMGNFCNVDLDYPLLPALGRQKRSPTITQAHVAYCHGDRVVARNVRFISRLNMNPLNGARRILFDGCHMECTDDALTGNGVYLNCTIDLYGQKPFYTTHACGAVFLNCDFRVMGGNRNMVFCKASGPLALIDCRYHASDSVRVGWTNYPDKWLRCYQHNFMLNGCCYTIGAEHKDNTVEIGNFELLRAFRIALKGEKDIENIRNLATIGQNCAGKQLTSSGEKHCSFIYSFGARDTVLYNIYNLLRGDDMWDVYGERPVLERLGAAKPVATFLKMNRRKAQLQTGGEAVVLRAEPRLHGDYHVDDDCRPVVRWHVEQGAERYVELSATEGDSVVVTPCNNTDETAHFCIEAFTDSGLQGAVEMEVLPSWLPAPEFTRKPSLSAGGGVVTVDYALDLAVSSEKERPDRSLITWYRCRDASGGGAVPVAVSRYGVPERTYRLTAADMGWYVMAVVEPRHNRSMPGRGETAVAEADELMEDGGASAEHTDVVVDTDFSTLPTAWQPQVLPGFWTVDGYKPADTAEYPWTFDADKDMWTYGEGFNGAVGRGLLQAQRGARLLYTPVGGSYGDMEVTLLVDPTKTAGQGFGSATGQYMDVYIKFDTRTLTGYALRIIRTVKHAKAVDFLLVRYENGVVTPVTEAVSSVCYRTGCTIRLRACGNRLSAHVETSTPLPADSALPREVNLEADIVPNSFGGTGVQHTGTCGESTTMLHRMTLRTL